MPIIVVLPMLCHASLNNSRIKLWDRYVDDVGAIVKTSMIDDILHSINNTTDRIKFTKEKEHDKQLAFLDFLLTRKEEGAIETQVYRKRRNTDQMLNYNRNYPNQHKVSCLRSMFDRVETHCNTAETKQAELKYLHETFRKNNYPKSFIEKYKTTEERKSPNTSQENKTDTKTKRTTSLVK